MEQRRWEIDALRGLMLVLMTLTHLPTRLSDPFGQPFGYVSAAEGFVLLSAYMAGTVYTRRGLQQGEEAMREAFWLRALKIYGCQAALLIFLFSFVAVLGLATGEGAITGLMSFYLERPGTAFVASLLLLYNPPLLDILPIYIVFMIASPLLVGLARRIGWAPILALGALAWAGAQFGLGRALQSALIALTGLQVPPQQGGAFDVLAWAFLWLIGLWLGAAQAAGEAVLPARWPRPWIALAVLVAALGFGWRHAIGQTPFHLPGQAWPNLLFDKWHLGPARMLDVFALLVLTLRFGPALARRLPRLQALETLGSASLPVFCAHLVIALIALALAGHPKPERPLMVDAVILVGGFALLYAVALASAALDRHAAAVQKRFKARQAARRSSSAARGRAPWRRRPAAPAAHRADVPRSPTSTAHSPPH